MLICLDMRTGADCGKETVDEARFCEHCGQNLRFALLLHDVGTLVGRYQVVRVIGYGGFGAIYEARSPSGERVALKETFDTSSISTFKREFAVLSRLSHVNLPRYIEMFEAEGNGYLVMEYVPGQSLQDVLDSQMELLPESQVLGYALQLCDVLYYLHSQQPPIVHRDVKPANIRLTPEGRIKLVDFGLLKQGGQQTRATIRGLGTLGYAPVEQYADNQQATNPRSDIYALGATLYHLLSGKEPPSALNRLTSDEELPSLPAGLSAHLKGAIIKAMSVMPKERFDDMNAFKQGLLASKASRNDFSRSSRKTTKAVTTKDETPVLEAPSLLSKATAWVGQTFTQKQSGYVMPSSPKSLPHLPLKTSGQVLKVAFYSDGAQQTLIGMTKKGIIYQWRVPDGQLLKLLSLAVFGEVEAIAYSPTGDTVATASKDYIIRIWRTQDGQLLHKLRGHGGLVKTLAYAPTGDVLASGSPHDKFICLWHVTTGKLLQKIDEGKPISKLAFSPDGTHLVSSQYSNSYVWHLANKKLLRTFTHGCTGTASIEWVGTRFVYGRNQEVVLQDAVTGEASHQFKYEDTYFMGVTLHPDGQQVAAGNSKGQLLVFMKGKSKPVYLCEAHKNRILSVAYTPDGRFLASGGQDQNVHLWALDAAYLPATTSPHTITPEVIESPSLNKDEAALPALSSVLFQQSTEIERLSNYVPATHELDLPHLVCDASGEVRTVGYHVNGKELLGITNEGIVYHWRIDDGKLVKKQALLTGQTKLTCAAISPDGQTIAMASDNLMVFIWRLKDGKLLHQLRGHTDEIKALAYTPDGQVLASSGGKDETIRFWGIANGKLLHMLKAKRESISLQFSPNGEYLACGSLHRVHIWGTRDKKWRKEIEKGPHSENNISWSPNGQLLLCGNGHNAYVWRVVDGQEMICFKGHENSIKAVAWHSNGQLALSTSYDRTIRIWSPLAPHLRHATKAHQKSIRCIAVSPDGRTFASGSEDGTVRLWFLADNLDKSLNQATNQPFMKDALNTQALETPIDEQHVPNQPTIWRTKTTSPNSSTREPSVLRKLSRWVTKQLLD